MRLLSDPEPNVRAAVLKQLATSPAPTLVPKIAEYAASEPDPDLVVHAIRFLREVTQASAVDALLPLFEHSSWRVRAEAADAVIQLVKDYSVRGAVNRKRLSEAFVQLLSDEDDFVVSRAVRGLESADNAAAMKPLVRTADQRPELAPDIIRILAENEVFRGRALPDLERYCDHENKQVRAAAITHLLELDEKAALPHVKGKLGDPESVVRIAAANAVFQKVAEHLKQRVSRGSGAAAIRLSSRSSGGLIEGLGRLLFGGETRPESDTPIIIEEQTPEQPAELVDEVPASPGDENSTQPESKIENAADVELTRIRSERELPKWVYEVEPLLDPLLSAETLDERVAAAQALASPGAR